VFYYQLMIEKTTVNTRKTDIEIALIIPFHRAVIAAYQCGYYQQSVDLAMQGLTMITTVDIPLWQTRERNSQKIIEYFEFLMIDFGCESLLELQDYAQALPLVERYQQLQYLEDNPDCVFEAKIKKAGVLLGLNRVSEAQALYL
jgi:hypothetical protein